MVASMRNGRVWSAFGRRVGPTRRGPDDRGAVLIEALIVIPLLMMMTLGIIEYGGAYREDATVASASRAGARVASALSKTDFGVTSASTDSGVMVARAVASALQSLGSTSPQILWIYNVATAGTGPNGSTPFSGCTNCVGYTWVSSTKSFSTTRIGSSPGWLGTQQNACAGGTIDQIGVWIQTKHTAVTHMFGTGRLLTGNTVMRFEPDVSPCA
jgi:Flp pilus assembly protein TadG